MGTGDTKFSAEKPKVPEPGKESRWTPAGVVAVVIGFAVARYTSGSLIIPLFGSFVVLKLIEKVAPLKKDMKGATAVQGGHALWFLIACALAPEAISLILFDLILFIPGILWLFLRPSKASAGFLSLYQVGSIFVNGSNFLSAEIGTATHKALLVHLIFRLLAVCLIWAEFKKVGPPSVP